MTLDQWRRLEKCESIVYGKAVASARRVCFETMALPAWKKDPTYGPLLLKKMWCDDMPYSERITACLKNKIKTMPSSLISATSYKPQGPVTTGWKAMVIISCIHYFPFSLFVFSFFRHVLFLSVLPSLCFKDCRRKIIEF